MADLYDALGMALDIIDREEVDTALTDEETREVAECEECGTSFVVVSHDLYGYMKKVRRNEMDMLEVKCTNEDCDNWVIL